MAREPHVEPRHSGWEIFVLALSLVSLANIVLLVLPLHEDSHRVILIVDAVICMVFFAGFAYRLRAAESKRRYLVREGGVLDLIGSIPIPGFRIFRVYRATRGIILIRRHGGHRVWRDFVRERAQGAMYVVLLLVVLVLEFASIGVLYAERDAPGSNIEWASDALWWGYVPITTVGYGDAFPVTTEGRIVGVMLLTIGVGRSAPSRRSSRTSSSLRRSAGSWAVAAPPWTSSGRCWTSTSASPGRSGTRSSSSRAATLPILRRLSDSALLGAIGVVPEVGEPAAEPCVNRAGTNHDLVRDRERGRREQEGVLLRPAHAAVRADELLNAATSSMSGQ